MPHSLIQPKPGKATSHVAFPIFFWLYGKLPKLCII